MFPRSHLGSLEPARDHALEGALGRVLLGTTLIVNTTSGSRPAQRLFHQVIDVLV